MRTVKIVPVLSLVLALMAACTTSQPATDAHVPVQRLDSLLMRGGGAPAVYQADTTFARLWAELLGCKSPQATQELLTSFASDPAMQSLEDSVLAHFPTVSDVSNDLRVAFARLEEGIYDLVTPRIYFFNGGFNASILLADSVLGIGLDRFLGPQCPYYDQLGVPHYLARWMYAERIAPQALTSWLSVEYPLPPDRATVLDHMLADGKVRYCVAHALRHLPDTTVQAFSKGQLEWLHEHERAIWLYLSDRKLLYERNPLIVNQLTKPGPFTSAFGQDSPGQVASWIGYRIVEAYMDRNPDLSLGDLLRTLDPQEILSGARYKP